MRRGMPRKPAICCGPNVKLNPMRKSQKCQRPSFLLSTRPIDRNRSVGVNAPRHAEEAGDMLRPERQIESNEEKPEMPEAQFLVKHPAHCFWIPVINGGKDGERKTADQHVMK